MKCFFAILVFILPSAGSLFAQHAHFMRAGVIEFEKTINMHALVKKFIENDDLGYYARIYADYSRKPQFRKLTSTLTFSGNKMLFSPAVGKVDISDDPMSNQPNTILTDLIMGTSINQKKVYEEQFLISGGVRKITWKITDEFREIAGYPCRRANAIILDSIYVVAFYTDEIAVSGGPESFTGLPGMILGVALPHDNVTWFATRVMEVPVAPASLDPQLKGKPLTLQQFHEKLSAVFKEKNYYTMEAWKAFCL